MLNIRVDVPKTIIDGYEVVFIAPCDCTEVKGLTIYYPDKKGEEANATFVFKDAHGSVLSDMNHLFKEGAYVKVILNVTDGIAYIQNADTNSYIESKFSGVVVTVEVGNWIQQEDGTYTNTVDVGEITEDDMLDASLYGEYTEEQAEAFDFLIEEIKAKDGQVVFISSDEINVSLSILLRGRVNMEEKNVFVKELKASVIEYDNSKSNLKSTDTQGAIDELATSINGLVVVVTAGDWNIQDDGTFRKIIPVEQVTGDETFDVCLYPKDIPTEEQVVAFSEYITSIETSEGAIILTATEEINVQFRILLYGKINFDNNVVLMKEYSAVDIAFDDTVAKLGAKNIQEADVALALRPVNNNILINSNFANPVNQRGGDSYTHVPTTSNTSIYSIDRWRLYEGTMAFHDGFMNVSCDNPNGEAWIMQIVEFPEKYSNKALTLSLRYRVNSTEVDAYCAIYRSDDSTKGYLECDGEWHEISITAHAGNITHLYASIRTLGVSSFDLAWMKLELGDHATPYVPRLYEEELQLCKRYFERVILNVREGGYGGFLLAPNDYTTSIMVLKQEIKRINPTITIPNVDKFYLQVGNTTSCEKEYGISNIDTYSAPEYIQVQFKHVSITQPFRSLTLRPGAYVDVDAEL